MVYALEDGAFIWQMWMGHVWTDAPFLRPISRAPPV